MILVIDNYDSFVHNLSRYVREAGETAVTRRNDELTLEGIADLAPAGIILSPGPGRPERAGVCCEVLRCAARTPILGVCLGHQCLGLVHGMKIVQAAEPMHGRASLIRHDGTGLLNGLQCPMSVGRYHSLVAVNPSGDLLIQSRSDAGDIMAMRHRTRPHHGVQFHPESLLTHSGRQLITNFIRLCQETRTA